MINTYIKMKITNAEEVYIRRDSQGFVPTSIFTLQEEGWTLYGISRSGGWLYWKKAVKLIDN